MGDLIILVCSVTSDEHKNMFFIISRIFLQNHVIMVIKNPCNFIGRRLSRYVIILSTLLVLGTVVVEYDGVLISEDHVVIHVTL